MKQIVELPILLIILSLAWLATAQAQQTNTSKVGGNMAAHLDQLRTLAEKGDQEAQYQLAERYRVGFPVEQDHERALEFYNRSAGQGFAPSLFRLGELYEEGEIVERDLGKAVESYRKAAERGHPGAQYALAHIYHLGGGVEQDMAAAMSWYRKAALQGDEWSQLALGDQYRIGLAVPRDLVQSTKWYRRAAEQGNAFAQYELGNAYRYGNGVHKAPVQAIEWYRLSAEAGNPSARLALAELVAGDTAAVSVTAPTPEPEAPQDAGSDVFASSLEADLAFSGTAMKTAAEEKAAKQRPDLEEAPQNASSVPPSGAVARGAELAFAMTPSFSDEEAVSQLLALAEDQMARLALTTPKGDNAYETYQLVLSIQSNNQAALDGIEQIGVKYVELASLAAAKGDLQKARHYAAKATELAPEHPLVQSMTVPMEAERPTTEATTLTPETLADIKTPQRAPSESEAVTAKIEVAAPASASATPNDLVQDTDDLIFKPYDYLGRQVVVAGSVVHLLGLYRLKSKTGQNSIVIDVDGLSQADRAKLDAAVEKAGFLGQVHARIKGTIERQKLVTFQLAATELTLTGTAPSEDEALNQGLDPDLDEGASPVAPFDPGEPSVQTNGSNERIQPGDPGRAGATAANSNGGGLSRASVGGSNSSVSGGSGDSGGSGGENSGGRNYGAPIAAPVYYQPAPAYVPNCYQDTVWRRLPDGRIQTGTRTRCY